MIYRLRRNDGVYRQILDNGAPFYRDGKFAGYFGSCIDVTEQQAAESQLRESQKMDAVGQLTGGIAHDFNNLLQVIGGNLQLVAKDVAGNERAETRLKNALTGVSRAASLASQLLAFSRRQPLAPKITNVGRLLRGMDDMLRRALGETIELETVVAGGLWNTLVDPAQVDTALLNLAINARDGMSGRGKLTVEAGNAWLDDAYAAQHTDVSAGQYVMIAVSDTGAGIPADMIDKVFEPFFTTKPTGQGTGLGLSMVHGFVKQSGGHIKIYSEVGHGTTVRIYFPRSYLEEEAPMDRDAGPIAGGNERVLIVEDDEDVRATSVAMLSELGYRVIEARNADVALTLLEKGAEFEVLFIDVVMPGKLQSKELARLVHEKSPMTAILFTSGYTGNAIVHGGRLDEGTALLIKPYTKKQLAQKFRQIIDRIDRRGFVNAQL